MDPETQKQLACVINRIMFDTGFLAQQVPPLFHYTDYNGLAGIVSNDLFWATNAKFLNDASEVKYGFGIATQAVHERQRSATNATWKRLLDVAEQFLSDPDSELSDAYVVCFCQYNNLLSQWRIYGAGGGGYSMEFGFPSSLPPGTSSDFRRRQTFLAKVTYEPDEQRGLLNELLDKVEEEVVGLREEKLPPGENMEGFSARILDALLPSWLYTVKDRAFSSEHEWRLVLLPSVSVGGYTEYCNLLFRSGRTGLIPYITVRRAPKLPLTSVTCGPSVSHEMAEHTVRMFLKKHGFEEAAKHVTSSTVPVRHL
jgi:hypothetical protein